MTGRFVVCMKWGTAFAPDYVNVLHSACRAAAARPFRFLCLTDDAAGLAAGIEALPIPDLGLSPADWRRPGVWPKIALFDGRFHGLRGRGLFIDLDMVVVRDIDAFLDHPGEVVGVNAGPGWGRPGAAQGPAEFGSMIFAWDLGVHGAVADRFRADPAAVWTRHRQEQQYVHACFPDAAFWPEGWVVSFKRALRRPVGVDLVLPPRAPSGKARVVAFHGRPRPLDLIRGRPRFWDRFPHMGHGVVPWMADYWRRHGGGAV